MDLYGLREPIKDKKVSLHLSQIELLGSTI